MERDGMLMAKAASLAPAMPSKVDAEGKDADGDGKTMTPKPDLPKVTARKNLNAGGAQQYVVGLCLAIPKDQKS